MLRDGVAFNIYNRGREGRFTQLLLFPCEFRKF
jgi:hypothetical protein